MPGDETLYAYTEANNYRRYPAYLNVTRRAVDGCYLITVRSRDTLGSGVIVLSPAQFAAFKLDVGIEPPAT